MPNAANLAVKMTIDKTPEENQPRGFLQQPLSSHNGNAICPPEPNQQAVYINA